MKKKNDLYDYLFIILPILMAISIIIAIVRIKKQEPVWINVGLLVIQGCLFKGGAESYLKEKKQRREAFQKHLKEGYAQEQILNQCQECSYYSGQVYGNNLLVCGMHPYGQEDCPDYK